MSAEGFNNGAHFDGDQSGTVNGVTPPAVQHLTAEVTADSGEYQVLARWDTPKVVKGVSFMLRLTVAADDGSERLVSTARTTETTYRFTQLALGNYRLTVRAVNAWGQQGDSASVSFRIAAPAAPSRIELTPGYFQITATPHLAVYDPTVQFEFWFSEKRIADIRQVETSARYLGTALYWISKSFPKQAGTWGNTETPNGTVTVTISDDHNFDRQIIIPPIIFNGIAYSDPGSGNNPGGTRYTGYGFEVRKNGVLIASRETKGAIPGSYSAVIDMPSGRGSVTLEFKIFQKGNQGAGNITDCTVIVTKKAASGISIR
ncbi:hypothetical protein CCE12_05720 [Escherichia coli]|nr:hypothetical protein CCE12_05720 [Escherichia coli]OWH20246.1 hypothetical protein CCE10_05740 [Escherichia coli]